jgi:predicted AAA+ superfamily ATPase
LLVHEVPAWRRSKSRKPLVSSKYYFFDVGVVSALQGRQVRPRTPEFGGAFETWLFHELLAYRDYESGPPISHWRSASGFEVDFVLGDHTAIEVKAKESVSANELRALRAIADERTIRRCICVSLEPRARTVDGIRVVPYGEFLRDLWRGKFA